MGKSSPATGEGSPAARGSIPVLVPDGTMSALIRWRLNKKTMLEKKGFQCMMSRCLLTEQDRKSWIEEARNHRKPKMSSFDLLTE